MPLQDSDNFIVGRGSESYKISYQDLKDDLNVVPPPSGTINKPVILAPADGAGSGVTRDIVTDEIIAVEGDGIKVCETDEIENVNAQSISQVAWGTNGAEVIDFSSLPDSEVLTFLVITQGTAGAEGCPGRQSGSPIGGYGGGSGGTGAIFYRRMTKNQYIDEFGSALYTQQISNNFNGTELKAQGAAGRKPWGTSNCNSYPGGATGPNGVEMTDYDFTFLNTLFPGQLEFKAAINSELDTNLLGGTTKVAGKGGNQPITGGPFGGDTGAGGQGGNAGIQIVGSGLFDSVPETPRAPDGGRPPNVPGNRLPSYGGYGAYGWGAGGAGGGGGANHSVPIEGGGSFNVTDGGVGADGGPGINLVVVGAENTILSFPSSNNFDCFEPGDVVQSDWNQSQVWSEGLVVRLNGGNPLTNWASQAKSEIGAFDGNLTTEAAEETGFDAGSKTYTVTFDPPIENVFTAEVYTYQGNSYEGGTISFGNGTVSRTQDNTTVWMDGRSTIPVDGKVSTFVLEATATQSVGAYRRGFAAIRINGEILVDRGIVDPDGVKVISKDDSDPFTITVDGGTWTTSDKLTKDIPYDTKLTLAGAKDLADLNVGDVVKMGLDADVPYQPVSDSIVSVSGTAPAITLTLASDQDLAYFRPGDVVQETGAKIISIDESVPSITVDGGKWDTSNQSQVWSAGADANWDLPYTNGIVYPASNLFDGDLTNGAFCGGANQGFITMNINVTEKLRFKGYGGPSIWTVTLGGQEVPVPFTTTGGELLWVDVPGTGQLTRITNNNKGGAVSAIEVDGKILVDQGITGLGDTEVTCQSPLKAPTDWTVEAIEGNTLSLSHATPNDNAQVWVANDNQAGTDFFVTGPKFVDNPLLTADVELESSLFASTPPGVDTLNNIVWELNGVEQDAGTSNPYKPTLNINTTYTVRVKHQGNILEDSPWSDQTTFTTGATRNLYTYYKERVEMLESRLASIESNEITDDAVDTALITLIGNLNDRITALEGDN